MDDLLQYIERPMYPGDVSGLHGAFTPYEQIPQNHIGNHHSGPINIDDLTFLRLHAVPLGDESVDRFYIVRVWVREILLTDIMNALMRLVAFGTRRKASTCTIHRSWEDAYNLTGSMGLIETDEIDKVVAGLRDEPTYPGWKYAALDRAEDAVFHDYSMVWCDAAVVERILEKVCATIKNGRPLWYTREAEITDCIALPIYDVLMDSESPKVYTPMSFGRKERIERLWAEVRRVFPEGTDYNQSSLQRDSRTIAATPIIAIR